MKKCLQAKAHVCILFEPGSRDSRTLQVKARIACKQNKDDQVRIFRGTRGNQSRDERESIARGRFAGGFDVLT